MVSNASCWVLPTPSTGHHSVKASVNSRSTNMTRSFVSALSQRRIGRTAYFLAFFFLSFLSDLLVFFFFFSPSSGLSDAASDLLFLFSFLSDLLLLLFFFDLASSGLAGAFRFSPLFSDLLFFFFFFSAATGLCSADRGTGRAGDSTGPGTTWRAHNPR